MDNKLSQKDKLPIPTNCPDADDLVPGIGRKEIMIIGVSFLVAVITALRVYLKIGNVFTCLVIAASIVFFTVIFVKRNQFQESFIDNIKQVIDYHLAQKRFQYEYYNIYEGEGK